jgi:hypothetical protein
VGNPPLGDQARPRSSVGLTSKQLGAAGRDQPAGKRAAADRALRAGTGGGPQRPVGGHEPVRPSGLSELPRAPLDPLVGRPFTGADEEAPIVELSLADNVPRGGAVEDE